MLKHTWKKCCFNYASNLTPDFKEALHEKRKDQAITTGEGRKTGFGGFKIKPRKWGCQFYVTFIPHLTTKKTSVAESFPTTPRQMSLMLSISDIYHLIFYKSASAAIQSISIYTMIHLADSFIQSEQHCFEGEQHCFECYQFKHSLGTETMTLALLSHHALQQGYSVNVSRGPVSISPSQYYIRTILFGIVIHFQQS